MIFRKKIKNYKADISESERKKRRREIVLIIVVIAVIFSLAWAENKIIHLGEDLPVSNTILMFMLININLLLLILLVFLVFRNLVKLLYERRRKVMGSMLRTRLVLAFIGLTLLPTSVLFIFSINFIANSIEFWFNVPVENTLENSLRVGRQVYSLINDSNRFFIERIGYQIHTKKLMDTKKRKALENYISVVQREFNIESVEIYDGSRGSTDVTRIAFAARENFNVDSINPLAVEQLRRNQSSDTIWSISDALPVGELVRSAGTVPIGEDPKTAEAFIVLSTLISSSLTKNMGAISKGIDDYKQKKMLKEPIRLTYYLTMLIAALLVLFCAIWLGFHLAKTLTIPIKQLAEGTRKVAEGDLSFTIGPVGDDEIGSLVDSFNKMTHDLRIGREQLEASALKLKEQNIEIEARRRYMEIVLNNVSTGVISLDANRLVTTINKSAEKMLNIVPQEILNTHYSYLLKDQAADIGGQITERMSRTFDGKVEFPLKATIDGTPRSFIIRANTLWDEAGRSVGLVMVFDDLTELEKAQRMAAWREVARRIAHEVKNPLTPIKLSAQRLKRKYSYRLNEPVFEECTQMIIDHVDLIGNLVNEFSAYARFPAANPTPCELASIIEETVALFKEGHRHIRFETQLPQERIVLNVDRHQIKQALINLVTNAVAAVPEVNGHIAISLSRNIPSKIVRIEVADNGIGVSDEEKLRLFEPYFSTKIKGMGLGLSIVNSIVTDHNGKITVHDNLPQGARFMIELRGDNSELPADGALEEPIREETVVPQLVETERQVASV